MSAAPHIGDGDLHAFADNFLPLDRRASVLTALEADTVEGRRVADWCSQNEAIRRVLGKTAFEPLPAALSLAGPPKRDAGVAAEKSMPRLVEPAIAPAAPRPHRRRWRKAARLMVLALIVGGAGLVGMLSGRVESQLRPQGGTAWRPDPNPAGNGEASIATFSTRAIEAHRTFAADSQSPVEIGSGQLPRLAQWFERRLGQAVKLPDLRSAGFALLGGRLIPGPRGPLGLLVYQNIAGERIALTFGRGDGGGGTIMYYRTSQGVGVATWAQDGDMLSLSGPADPIRLSAAARVASASFQASELRQ